MAIIGLGSNVGDRLTHLREAVLELKKHGTVQRLSSAYETAPLYVEDQGSFLNAVLLYETDLGPLELLKQLKQIESEIGRQSRQRYGPREIDLDLLAYGQLQYAFHNGSQVRLQVPHPKIVERRFVLEPLAEIAPSAELPGMGIVLELVSSIEVQNQHVSRLPDAIL
ncbi:MAG: 2-amino-4-hydroxy-6-hydroxymethyldihydropteridine diphosphokinase [Armatimonadetes bacterium]|nr:2-amino-4-hydroxy-6-hydroxymethyldihydropteridine diphosphokinase [Armatimonadota bacterium]